MGQPMNNILKEQIELLAKTLDFQVDGKPSKDFPESFSEITFMRSNKTLDDKSLEKVFVFEDYIIKPYQGFDFHDKFNNGIAPPEKTMQGFILRETEKMWYLSVHTFDNMKFWMGYCPKKSVRIDL